MIKTKIPTINGSKTKTIGRLPTNHFIMLAKLLKIMNPKKVRKRSSFSVILRMILYNVTVSIDPSIEADFKTYMREQHIPDVLNTGRFMEARFCRVHGEEEGGVTYATTYLAASQEELDTYQANEAKALQADFNQKWSGKFAAFRTLLTVVEEFKKK